MNPHWLVLLVGFFYILVVGGTSLLRREALSGQFALEALAITGLAVIIGWATGAAANPIMLFVILYLVTLRARLLTDLANLLLKRRGYAMAERLYQLALRLFPNRTDRFIVLVNWGIARLQAEDVEGAISTLGDVLAAAGEHGGLGPKYESACRYNLAVAYRRAGHDAQAGQQFDRVIELLPASIYGQAAKKALQERRERGLPKTVR